MSPLVPDPTRPDAPQAPRGAARRTLTRPGAAVLASGLLLGSLVTGCSSGSEAPTQTSSSSQVVPGPTGDPTPSGSSSSSVGAVAPTSAGTPTSAAAPPGPPSAAGTATAGPRPTTATPPAAGATVDGASFGRDVVAAMRAARTGRSTLTLRAGGVTTSYATEFAYAADGALSTRATGTGPAGASEVIAVGSTTYTRLPQPVDGRTWSRSTGGEAALGSDPAAITAGFAASRVTYVGESGGRRHYTLVSTGRGGGTVEAYLDGLGRPVRFDGTASGLTVTATYADWGSPVTVTAPPADQVTPA